MSATVPSSQEKRSTSGRPASPDSASQCMVVSTPEQSCPHQQQWSSDSYTSTCQDQACAQNSAHGTGKASKSGCNLHCNPVVLDTKLAELVSKNSDSQAVDKSGAPGNGSTDPNDGQLVRQGELLLGGVKQPRCLLATAAGQVEQHKQAAVSAQVQNQPDKSSSSIDALACEGKRPASAENDLRLSALDMGSSSDEEDPNFDVPIMVHPHNSHLAAHLLPEGDHLGEEILFVRGPTVAGIRHTASQQSPLNLANGLSADLFSQPPASVAARTTALTMPTTGQRQWPENSSESDKGGVEVPLQGLPSLAGFSSSARQWQDPNPAADIDPAISSSLDTRSASPPALVQAPNLTAAHCQLLSGEGWEPPLGALPMPSTGAAAGMTLVGRHSSEASSLRRDATDGNAPPDSDAHLSSRSMQTLKPQPERRRRRRDPSDPDPFLPLDPDTPSLGLPASAKRRLNQLLPSVPSLAANAYLEEDDVSASDLTQTSGGPEYRPGKVAIPCRSVTQKEALKSGKDQIRDEALLLKELNRLKVSLRQPAQERGLMTILHYLGHWQLSHALLQRSQIAAAVVPLRQHPDRNIAEGAAVLLRRWKATVRASVAEVAASPAASPILQELLRDSRNAAKSSKPKFASVPQPLNTPAPLTFFPSTSGKQQNTSAPTGAGPAVPHPKLVQQPTKPKQPANGSAQGAPRKPNGLPLQDVHVWRASLPAGLENVAAAQRAQPEQLSDVNVQPAAEQMQHQLQHAVVLGPAGGARMALDVGLPTAATRTETLAGKSAELLPANEASPGVPDAKAMAGSKRKAGGTLLPKGVADDGKKRRAAEWSPQERQTYIATLERHGRSMDALMQALPDRSRKSINNWFTSHRKLCEDVLRKRNVSSKEPGI